MESNQYIDGTYLAKVPGWHANDAPWKAGHIHRIIEKNKLTPHTVCDVGCGAGQIIVELKKRLSHGVSYTGYDISPDAIALCAPHQSANVSFRVGDFLQTSERYDLLMLLDVFEHVRDYLSFLEALNGRARWFILHIPLDLSVQALINGSHSIIKQRKKYGHLHYFNKQTAFATLADTGYKVVDYAYTFDLEMGPVPSGVRPKLFFWAAKLIDKMNQELAARYFTRHNLLVLAVKA